MERAKKATEVLTPIAVTSQQMTFSNVCYLSPVGNIPRDTAFVRVKEYILSCVFSDSISTGKIGLNKKCREFLRVSLIDELLIVAYIPKPIDCPAASISIRIQFLLPPTQRAEIDDVQLCAYLKNQFSGFFVSVGQIFVLNYAKVPHLATIQRVVGPDNANCTIAPNTILTCQASPEQRIKLKSTKQAQRSVFDANFTMSSLGIGGLNQELTNLFRRAFASRRLPHSIIEKFGIKHVKGILLYGPPGTGKTLIARQLANALKAKKITVVNGPQLFSKYVGESEENVRKQFLPAREDEKKYGQDSQLHVIVFDEIDALCRQRGGDSSGSSMLFRYLDARDAVVNQLLTNMDGVEALNNILVIGMTNRKDLLDQAILRPGRLQVHIEIGIPNEEGRQQILQIHTRTLKEQKLLDKSVDLHRICQIAKNYTGAELQAVVKSASSFAMTKGSDINDFSKPLELKQGTTVTMDDLLRALQEIKPSFGLDQQHFQVLSRGEIIPYGKSFDTLMSTLKRIADSVLNGQLRLKSVLLYGESGTGKTSLATHFAKQCQFGFVKVITAEKFIGVGAMGKITMINKVFSDAYKAKQSLIIIDNVERLIQYVQTGPDFNNYVLQSLLVLMKRVPPNPNCRLMIIGTSSHYEALNLVDADQAFPLKIKTPLLKADQCTKILGCDLKISQVPIKKLCNFKAACEDKPKSIWGNLWIKYNL